MEHSGGEIGPDLPDLSSLNGSGPDLPDLSSLNGAGPDLLDLIGTDPNLLERYGAGEKSKAPAAFPQMRQEPFYVRIFII